MEHSIRRNQTNSNMKHVLLIAILLTGIVTHAQSAREQALARATEAFRLEDEEGKFDEAIKLLEEARQLEPDRIDWPYEIAYAYMGKKEYKKASDLLQTLLHHKDINPRVYQSLGNAYDFGGNPLKAVETYREGLKKFPAAGELFLELGNMQMAAGEYKTALTYYENGIEKDPAFASNYYWAAKIFCNSSEAIWGLIYGELFMNMERGSRRTSEISSLLYKTYKDRITISDDSATVKLCQSVFLIEDMGEKEKIKLPFCTVFETDFAVALIDHKQIDLQSLNKIRTAYLELYNKNHRQETHPNILFDYQRKIREAGHFEAYNYWLLSKGDEKAFEAYMKNNRSSWDAFISWYTNNAIEINKEKRFYRRQY